MSRRLSIFSSCFAGGCACRCQSLNRFNFRIEIIWALLGKCCKVFKLETKEKIHKCRHRCTCLLISKPYFSHTALLGRFAEVNKLKRTALIGSSAWLNYLHRTRQNFANSSKNIFLRFNNTFLLVIALSPRWLTFLLWFWCKSETICILASMHR